MRQQRRGGDSYIHATLTRFIPGKVARLFERVDPAPPHSDAAGPVSVAAPVVDVSSTLRAMWD